MLRGVRPSIVLAFSQILVEGSAFLRNLILARLVGAEQMGLAVALALGIRLLEMMGDFGLERYLVQAPASRLRQVRGSVHLIQVVKGCLLTGVWSLTRFALRSTRPSIRQFSYWRPWY
jgi:O-antigen/teichoic acid export membrane protein